MACEWNTLISFLDILEYYERDLPVDSEERDFQGGVRVNPSEIQEWSVLPSVNVIFKLQENPNRSDESQSQFFQSIARPSFREISSMSLLILS